MATLARLLACTASALLAFASQAHAQDAQQTSPAGAPGEATHCGWDDFMTGQTPIRVAQVKKSAGPRVHFRKDDAHCAKGVQRPCQDRAYLVPDDTVAVAGHRASLACVWFNRRNVNDEIVGWLPADALDELPVPTAPALSSWTKEWSRFIALGNESSITITLAADGHALHAKGFAEWMGGGATEPNMGEFEGSALPQGNHLTVNDNGCVVEMFLLSDSDLFVRDHFDCGGMNVTFRGLY
jgi:hypothetical protein